MIASNVNKISYQILSPTPIGGGYIIPYKFWDDSELTALLTSSDGIESVIDPQDYVITKQVDDGLITFDQGYSFPPDAVVLTIYRTIPLSQETDLRDGDILSAEVLEMMFDRHVAQTQQLNERVRRALLIPISDPDSSLEMPSVQIRKGMLLGFDENGDLITVLQTDIEQKLSQALAAENSVLSMYNDAGMVAVRTDMADPQTSKIQAVALNKNHIDAVAADLPAVRAVSTDILKVVSVANNMATVIAVKNNETNINAVKANEANINIVALNKVNIDIVALNKAIIDAVAANETNINTLAGDLDLGQSSTIRIAASIAQAISAVAANETNINAVNANESNVSEVATDLKLGASSTIKGVYAIRLAVSAVAANETNINAVKNNETNINIVALNKVNIDTVANDLNLGGSSNVKIVSLNIADIGTVATNIADILLVKNDLTNIGTVATNIAGVNTAATNIQAILNAPSEASAAASAKDDAENARDKARLWAEEDEDEEVDPGEYSAKHYSLKAAASASSAQQADAAANKHVTFDGTLYQYGIEQSLIDPSFMETVYTEVI